MALQAYSLIPKRTKKTHRVVADNFVVTIPNIEDLGIVVQQIAAEEITRQIKIDNDPRNIVVDNKSSKPFDQADFRITAYFANGKEQAKAAMDVITALRKTTTIGTRKNKERAINSFEVWTTKDRDDPGKREFPASSANLTNLTLIADTLPVNGMIVIVGPTVPYGRKLYWRPKGSSEGKYKGRVSKKAAYDADTGKTSLISGRRSTNQRDLVIGRTRSKNQGTLIIGRWVIMDGKAWPGIGIGLKTKGRLN